MIAPAASVVTNPVRRLPGMRDYSGDAQRDKQGVQSRVSEVIGRCGYRTLDVPILESTELFLRKSGGELASQMYSFNDPGSNAVSLRPEFTSAIMRHYLETARDEAARDGARATPVRWQYAGPVFRYDLGNPPSADNGGQFTQIGAELIGSDSILADAELLLLASEIPAELGITDYRLRLADLDVLDSVLDTVGLSDRARSFIVANMNRIGESADNLAVTLRRADELHLVSGRALPTDEEDLADAVAGLPDGLARSVLTGFMRWNSSEDIPLGRRSPDEIVDRLLRKLRGGDAADAIEIGLELAGRLARIRGNPSDALREVRAIIASVGASISACDRLERLVDLAQHDPALDGRLSIDFSLVRGIAYYNGIIFDVVRDSAGAPLGGGGRYDALALALGGTDRVPALGFAFTLESLVSAMPESVGEPEGHAAVLVKPGSDDSNAAALRTASEIRRGGGIAVLDVSGADASDGYSRTITV